MTPAINPSFMEGSIRNKSEAREILANNWEKISDKDS